MAKNRTCCCCCCRGLRRPPPHSPIGGFFVIILQYYIDSFISKLFFCSSPTSQSFFFILPSFKFDFFCLTVLPVGFLIVQHIIILYFFFNASLFSWWDNISLNIKVIDFLYILSGLIKHCLLHFQNNILHL